MKTNVIGVATTKFGELWDVSPRTLAKEAVALALIDSDIEMKHIQAVFVGNMLSGMLGGQEHLGAFFADEFGLSVPALKIEGACASGGLAMHTGVLAIESEQYDTVLVLGVEKMTDHSPEDVARALMGAGSEEERFSGATFPGLYAILAQAHSEKYGTTEEQMAMVAVKNHYHASLNPNAQFRSLLKLEQVMKSSKIADPLKLLDCSPITDGASAVILTTEVKSQMSKVKSIEVFASAVATDSLGLSKRKSLTELAATIEAGNSAYRKAGVGPKDIGVCEVHDCFTIAEILAMEDLGFYEKGQAAGAVVRGETTLGSQKKVVINPSGGLKGCGHPVGATGVKQIVEIVEQLRGTAGKRQVVDAKIGLAHNVGGSGATAVVHILGR
ncbi:thiolase domain-containing protein [Candidatus Gottesmanbacteria bacterium]|nr:thiolase domain-containing protein [Candidatus Gottesmanbacteria bacterium]